ncbi:hypothetical protein BKA56DRAFT_706811 [Ilyonectria sp. MPI-CAGE-AT-0026]|nr:hypothetical protein BKA56DRAFT_706811 [Ilyonectria sp. MPI-CAGE-AT-0026]
MPSQTATGQRGRYLVIGAGYAGLAVAIELRSKGFEVEVIEAVPELTTQGDIIQIGSNATRVMQGWGTILKDIQKDSAQPPAMTIWDQNGKELLTSPLPDSFDGSPVLFSNRGLIQTHIFNYAKSVGVKFRFGCRVNSYFETATEAGVKIGDEAITADGIIACDGIHSTARNYIMGQPRTARTSGFGVYRSWFSLDLLANHPLTKRFAESKEDEFHVWVGPDTHVILFTTISVRGAVIFCTHKDNEEVQESWSKRGELEDMQKVVEGWEPTVLAAMAQIPKDKIIDWKLLWRDPIKKWQSDNGRMVIAGDAAHPHLPTSGSGAAQALEDAATIAAVLYSLGSEKTVTAFGTFEKLRFERTSLTQRMGWETRHRWHQIDWDMVEADPEYLKMPQPLWLYCHDAAKYAYERCEEAAKSVETGAPFVSTNLPEGYVHEDWNIDMMMDLESQQAKEHFYQIANK